MLKADLDIFRTHLNTCLFPDNFQLESVALYVNKRNIIYYAYSGKYSYDWNIWIY